MAILWGMTLEDSFEFGQEAARFDSMLAKQKGEHATAIIDAFLKGYTVRLQADGGLGATWQADSIAENLSQRLARLTTAPTQKTGPQDCPRIDANGAT